MLSTFFRLGGGEGEEDGDLGGVGDRGDRGDGGDGGGEQVPFCSSRRCCLICGSDPEFNTTALSTSFARPHCTMYSLPTIMSLSSRKY